MASGTLTITAKQCKRARSILKWNPQDLASRTRISVRQIEKFERNQCRLLRPENEEIIKVFKKAGVTFKLNGDVVAEAGHGTDNTDMRFSTDSDAALLEQGAILADGSIVAGKHTPPPQPPPAKEPARVMPKTDAVVPPRPNVTDG